MNLQCFYAVFEEDHFQFKNPYLNCVMNDFHLILFSDDHRNDLKINQHKNINNIIIIDKYEGKLIDHKSCDLFIICADYFIILIQSSNISHLFQFFLLNKDSEIYCICPDAKPIIQKIINQNKPKIHLNFHDENLNLFINKEIPSFLTKCELDLSKSTNNLKRILQLFWKLAGKCVSGFLIKLAYLNSKYDRITHYEEIFNNNNNNKLRIKEDEYIELHYLSQGCSSQLYVAFLIKERKICILKFFIETKDKPKLFKRERDNYQNIHHPLFPRYFGETEYMEFNGLLIEYLEGQNLCNVKMNELPTKDRLKIILEIMIVIEYLHHNNYIYRDLKPNNIIIDKDNRAYLFDFDRMIKNPEIDSVNKDQEFTKDFSHQYFAPEIANNGPITNKIDIYSLGMLILYITSDECECKEGLIALSKQCTVLNPNERPNIKELIDIFYFNFFSEFNKIQILDNTKQDIQYHNEFFFHLLVFSY